MLRKAKFVNTLAFLLMSIIWSSCTTVKEVEVVRDVYHHDSIYITAVSIDTLIQRDSVHTIERGDTIQTTIYKYIYKVRERTDTIFRDRVDTFLMKKNIVKP